MKVFLFAYTKTNLGDDIFLKMISEKYKDVEFFINIPNVNDRKIFGGIDNVSFIENESDNRNLENINVDEYDAFVYIGGSIFIESERALGSRKKFNSFITRCNEKNKPFFYISSNFGPYKSLEYFGLSQETMKLCSDICFRDKYSFDLFSDISSVRYAPDLIFSYDVGKVVTEKESVGISVIDFEIRDDLASYSKKYFRLLANSINSYVRNGKKIYLFSFCEYEGDESGIEKLISYLDKEIIRNVEIIKYTGDVDEFMKVYKKMEYMICTRFHSMILSVNCNHKIYCVSYSKKMNNVAEDLGFNIEIKNIKDLDSDFIQINDFRKVQDDIMKYCKEGAQKQFDEFDKFVKGI